MDPETQKMLRETLRLSRENNEMLRRMRNADRWSRIWKTMKFIISIALLVSAYYFLAPYIQDLKESYEAMRDSYESFQEARANLPF